jgi:hypothetical protein
VLSFTRPAAASDPLGTVTAQTVSCESLRATHGVPGATCYLATVSCPGVQAQQVPLKVNYPKGTPAGTVLFTVGGGGISWYDEHFQYGATAVESVLNAGYITAQFNFDIPPEGSRGEQTAGWLTGPGGPRALACRWASTAKWIHDSINPTSKAFCATGNSNGAAVAGYALALYGLSPDFNMLEETSGPPLTRIADGCLCNQPSVQTPCGQGALSECYLKDANAFIDPAYDTNACSTAERTHRSGSEASFIHDSLDTADATYNFPSTDIHFVFGGLDDGSAVPEAVIWSGLITGKYTITTDCVADAGHEIADVLDGALKVANDLIAYCH